MKTWRHLKVVVCLIACTSGAACAHGSSSKTLMARFVHGQSDAGTGAPVVRKPADVEQWIASVLEIQANARPTVSSQVLVAEESDAALRASLDRLRAARTGDNERSVALAYYEAGILDAAHDHLTEALRLEPSDATAYDLRARIWRRWGFPDAALPDAHRAVYYAPRSAHARNTLGTVFAALGNWTDAKSVYLKAIELDPSAAYAWNNLCQVAIAQGDLVSGDEACRRALEIEPRLAVANRNLAHIRALLADADAPREK